MQPVFNPPLGWLGQDDLTPVGRFRHAAAVAQLAAVDVPPMPADVDKVILTDSWKHPKVIAALGYAFPGNHQLTGSCVGAGGGNALATIAFLDVIRFGHAERIIRPDWLRAYGRSRELLGDTRPGEGSTGATFAQAVLEGVCDGSFAGLPQPKLADGLEWSEGVEYQWSAAKNAPAAVVDESKRHPVKTISQSLTSSDQLAAFVANGYPCTFANSLYVNGATIQGTPPVAVGRFDRRGGHQTSIQGWWKHPQLGELFLYVNQWPASVYPADPGGGCRCSCWLSRREIDARFAAGNDVECYPFSGYEGYPAQPDVPALLNWLI